MDDKEPVAVILAGGEGRRFWPASTAERPKQFLRLLSERSLLRQTADRLQGFVRPERILVVTSEAYARLTLEHLSYLVEENLLLEPEPRNTAPALALAAGHIRSRFGNPPVMVLPADHYITDPAALQSALGKAVELCRAFEGLVTMGITPTRPETGYGYIRLGAREEGPVYRVAKFVEKPTLERARAYLASGGYLWNSGIFVWRNEVFLGELARHHPRVAACFGALAGDLGTPVFAERLKECYRELAPASVDKAVLERSTKLKVLAVGFAWDDVGTWAALTRHGQLDGKGNVVVGETAEAVDCEDCIIYSRTLPLRVIGVAHLVVAADGEGVLVCAKDRSSEAAPPAVGRWVRRLRPQSPT